MAAKEYSKPSPADSQVAGEIQRLAERLFVEHWKPANGSMSPDALGAICFRGAQQFLRVVSQIREGRTVDEILSPPEVPAAMEPVTT